MKADESTETRQRVERWMEEGQHLLGRIIPSLLEQLDRMKSRAEAAEQLSERLRRDLTELQTQTALMRTENEVFRREQAEIREVFARTRDHLSQLLQPIAEWCQKLPATPGTGA